MVHIYVFHIQGEVLPDEKRFDSNCITPGTEFMENLQAQLEFFVIKKVSTDPLWQKTQVILSGHQVAIANIKGVSFLCLLQYNICIKGSWRGRAQNYGVHPFSEKST